MKKKKQMNNILKIGLLFLVMALIAVPGVSALPTYDMACNSPGCHAVSTSISITATTPKTTVAPGESFVVTVTWSPSSATAEWPSTVNDNALFGIPSGGVIVSGSGIGTTTLKAPSAAGTYKVTVYASMLSGGPITNFKDITITVQAAPVLKTITVSPTSASKVVGGTQTFTAAGFDQNGASIAISPAVAWSSSNTTVGTINPTTGVFTALATGTATITARNGTSGTVSGTASITVSAPAPVLTTITVSPSTSSKLVGGTQTFTAAGQDQNGASITISPAVVWSSSDPAVGTIDSAGVFTALAAGTTTITATNGIGGTVSGTASVTVTAPVTPVLTTITVSPSTASLTVNGTQTFTATALDQLGHAIPSTFTWVSSNTTVGTIDASGKFTALSAGTTTITAANGIISGSAAVSVSASSAGHNDRHQHNHRHEHTDSEHANTEHTQVTNHRNSRD